MTTIVFDGKTLAVDTACYSGNTYEGEVSKAVAVVVNGEMCIVASCGDYADLIPFIDSLEGRGDGYDFSRSGFIVIKASNPRNYTVYEKGVKMNRHSLQYVNGSGFEIARGALFTDPDPVNAVKAACKHNAFTDYPIEVFEFDGSGSWQYKKIGKPA